eukprot:PhF_6_TR2607/c0_g1_i1/m.4404
MRPYQICVLSIMASMTFFGVLHLSSQQNPEIQETCPQEEPESVMSKRRNDTTTIINTMKSAAAVITSTPVFVSNGFEGSYVKNKSGAAVAPRVDPCTWLFYKVFRCTRGPLMSGERSQVVVDVLGDHVRKMCSSEVNGSTIIDVGANDGLELKMLKDNFVGACPKLRLLAFEPNEKYISALKQISPVAEVVRAFAGAAQSHGMTASLSGDGQRGFMGKAGEEGGTIPIYNIPMLIKDKNMSFRIPIIKIDAEGADGLILNSVLSLLKDQDTLVIYEISNWWGKHEPQTSPRETMEFLRNTSNYVAYIFGSSKLIQPGHFFIEPKGPWMDMVTPWLRWETGVAMKRGGVLHSLLSKMTPREFMEVFQVGARLRKLPACPTHLSRHYDGIVKCLKNRMFTIRNASN